MITIKDLFECWDVTRQEVCSKLNIPYRTLQNWLIGTRKCPEYVVLLLDEWMSKHCLPRKITLNYIEKLEQELSYGNTLLHDLKFTYYKDEELLGDIEENSLIDLYDLLEDLK